VAAAEAWRHFGTVTAIELEDGLEARGVSRPDLVPDAEDGVAALRLGAHGRTTDEEARAPNEGVTLYGHLVAEEHLTEARTALALDTHAADGRLALEVREVVPGATATDEKRRRAQRDAGEAATTKRTDLTTRAHHSTPESERPKTSPPAAPPGENIGKSVQSRGSRTVPSEGGRSS
jgi:hypothetical protein